MLAPAGPHHPIGGAEDHAGVVLAKVKPSGQHELFFTGVVLDCSKNREHGFLGIYVDPENAPKPDRTPS